ncbi:RCC1 domain-containing protein [Paenibacillus gorillae]|uniref:RCC1 domain-containing protein n=1 Tax=Paenibacillus gorillae TaxID=1243662 RepID=UPI0012DCD10F|nr:hypothetical protein [Paenibacillus gorillae]
MANDADLITEEVTIPEEITEEENEQEVISSDQEKESISLPGGKNSKIEAGVSSSFARSETGDVWVWGTGKNVNGEFHQSLYPVQPNQTEIVDQLTSINNDFYVPGIEGRFFASIENPRILPEIVDIKSKYAHTIALAKDGTVWGWGDNTFGQLGNGSSNSVTQTRAIQSKGGQQDTLFEGAVAIDVGLSHTIILKSDGTVWSAGNNDFGQLGDGTNQSRSIPVQVVTDQLSTQLDNVVAISAGKNFNIALKADGTVWSWGENNEGQLGEGTFAGKLHAVQVAMTDDGSSSSTTAIRAGGDHAIVLQSDGSVWAWGDNSCGQVGDGTFENRGIPVQVKGVNSEEYLTNVTEIAAGEKHNLAVHSDSIVSWGGNEEGQLGNGTTMNTPVPVQVVLQNQTFPVKEYYYTKNQLTTVYLTIGTSKYKQTFMYDLNGNVVSEETTQIQ